MAASFNVIDQWDQFRTINQLYQGIVAKSVERWTNAKARQSGFDYSVPYQWQGKFSCIKAIGDKKGSSISTALERDYDGK